MGQSKPISGFTCSSGTPGGATRLGDAPARSLTALAQRLGVSETDAATLVAPLVEEPVPVVAGAAAAPVSPLLPMTAPNGGSSAPGPC